MPLQDRVKEAHDHFVGPLTEEEDALIQQP
jgi:hypothetical protein